MKRINRKNKSFDIFRNFPDERDAWLLSYADVITMLLCFFVIFFSFEKQNSTSDFKDVMAFMKEELGLKNIPKSNLKNVKEMIKARFGDDQIVAELEKLNIKYKVQVLNYANYVAIEFPEGNMFNQGADILNLEGSNQLIPIIKALASYQKKLNINIVAYTDPVPVNKNQQSIHWWKNNRELSAQRALNVQNFFLNRGFSEGSVFITGRGIKTSQGPTQIKPYSLDGKLIDTQVFNQSRTISIRLESKDSP